MSTTPYHTSNALNADACRRIGRVLEAGMRSGGPDLADVAQALAHARCVRRTLALCVLCPRAHRGPWITIAGEQSLLSCVLSFL